MFSSTEVVDGMTDDIPKVTQPSTLERFERRHLGQGRLSFLVLRNSLLATRLSAKTLYYLYIYTLGEGLCKTVFSGN